MRSSSSVFHPLLVDPLALPLAGATIRKFADSLFTQHGISPPHQRLETLSLTLSRRYVQRSPAI